MPRQPCFSHSNDPVVDLLGPSIAGHDLEPAAHTRPARVLYLPAIAHEERLTNGPGQNPEENENENEKHDEIFHDLQL